MDLNMWPLDQETDVLTTTPSTNADFTCPFEYLFCMLTLKSNNNDLYENSDL